MNTEHTPAPGGERLALALLAAMIVAAVPLAIAFAWYVMSRPDGSA